MNRFKVTPTTLMLNPCYNPHLAGALDESGCNKVWNCTAIGLRIAKKTSLHTESRKQVLIHGRRILLLRNLRQQQRDQVKRFLSFEYEKISQDQKVHAIQRLQSLFIAEKHAKILFFLKNRKFLKRCFPVLLKLHCWQPCSPPWYISITVCYGRCKGFP